ncbi:MAG: hypothetical protein DI588_09180 [Flavobacterium johnsoniae]|nr:MAG: hypothetical protein DI588_09180 [Flavobacterium johnsoniae]
MNLHDSKRELRENFDMLIKYKDDRRSQEEIIADIISVIKDTKKEVLIPYIMQMINMIGLRHTSDVYKNLMSPLKQFAYVIDLYFSVRHSPEKDMPSEDEWNRLTELLMEIEMTYFGEIGFFADDSGSPELDKIGISLKSFFDFYSNAQLSYDEQTLDRLKNNFEKFNDIILLEYGFRIDDIVKFCLYIGELIRNKSRKALEYAKSEDWQKLITVFQEKGLTDPADWAFQPELRALMDFIMKPGSSFVFSKEIFKGSDLSEEVVGNLVCFLKFDEKKAIGKTVYYDEERQYFLTPIIEISSEELLLPPFKFLIEAFYNRINRWLTDIKKEKYTKPKNKLLEIKTLTIFKKFFKENALYFQGFYFDKDNRAEQDLFILYKGNALIIEIKDFKFRAPMRNPIKAFEKIRSDFKGGIQKAYEQCRRLEEKLEQNEKFKIFDDKNDRELYEVDPKKIKACYSIIITQHKYGAIQTDLSGLLIKDSDSLYPWSVCVDDLEIFLLGLIKIKKNSSMQNFINFLEYRECFHERLLCSDEMELCGLFINQQPKFRKYATEMDEYFATDIRMSNIFDAHYQNGLGFDNEINIDLKKKNGLGSYDKDFDVQIVSGNDLNI